MLTFLFGDKKVRPAAGGRTIVVFMAIRHTHDIKTAYSNKRFFDRLRARCRKKQRAHKTRFGRVHPIMTCTIWQVGRRSML